MAQCTHLTMSTTTISKKYGCGRDLTSDHMSNLRARFTGYGRGAAMIVVNFAVQRSSPASAAS